MTDIGTASTPSAKSAARNPLAGNTTDQELHRLIEAALRVDQAAHWEAPIDDVLADRMVEILDVAPRPADTPAGIPAPTWRQTLGP